MYSTGKSISVSVAVAMRACVRACEAVWAREGKDSFGARPVKSIFVVGGAAGRPAAGAGVRKLKKNDILFIRFDWMSVLLL